MRDVLKPFATQCASLRVELRGKGDFALADKLRLLSHELGFEINDLKNGKYTLIPNEKHWSIQFEVDGESFPYTAKNMVDRIVGISRNI